jgi:hypothetical protein
MKSCPTRWARLIAANVRSTQEAAGRVDGFGVGAGVTLGLGVGLAFGGEDGVGDPVASGVGEATATDDGLGAVVAHPARTNARSAGIRLRV